MSSKEYPTIYPQSSLGRDYQGCEALLRSEISFWQELIASCPSTQSLDSIERMSQALALAESRLVVLLEMSQQSSPGLSTDCPPRTSATHTKPIH